MHITLYGRIFKICYGKMFLCWEADNDIAQSGITSSHPKCMWEAGMPVTKGLCVMCKRKCPAGRVL